MMPSSGPQKTSQRKLHGFTWSDEIIVKEPSVTIKQRV